MIQRFFAPTLGLLIGLALSSCAPFAATVSDHWPTWAGGMPKDVPPRPGAPGYDEFLVHQQGKDVTPAAAAGENASLAPRIALACLAAVVLAAVLFTYLGLKESALERLHLTKSPEVLANKASETLAKIGYSERPVDRAWGLNYNYDFVNYVSKNDQPRANWSQIVAQRPELLEFWYRQSPHEMVSQDFWGFGLTPGGVTFDEPPPTLSGMITTWSDAEGRLQWLQAIPPQVESPTSPATGAASTVD